MAEVTQQQVVEYIKGISVLELSQLVKTLESELGVSAAAAMPMAMPAAAAAAAAAPAEEKTEFTVIAHRSGRQQDQRHQGGPRGHQRSASRKPRTSSRARPSRSRKASPKDEAAAIKKKFEEVGAKVEIK